MNEYMQKQFEQLFYSIVHQYQARPYSRTICIPDIATHIPKLHLFLK
jgi:hypothetical protein